MIISIDRTFEQISERHLVFRSLTFWLYNVLFPENYFFFWEVTPCRWVCSYRHFEGPMSSTLRTVLPGGWNRVLLRICHFSKSIEQHNQHRVVTPQNDSAFRNTAVRTVLFNPYFLTESPSSVLRFLMYSHNPSTSRPTCSSSTYKFPLSLTHSITHLLTPFLCHSHLAPPPTHPFSPTPNFLPTHFYAISFGHLFTLQFTCSFHLLVLCKHILCVGPV